MRRNFISLVAILALLVVSIPQDSSRANQKFAVDEYMALALEYSGPQTLLGINTLQPVPKAVQCQRGVAAAIVQAHDYLPEGHTMIATCLHVKFTGPIPNGAVVVNPFSGSPLEYVNVATEYDSSGNFVGAQALNPAPDMQTCVNESKDLVKTNYTLGKIPPGNSLIIYCVPIPVLPTDGTQPDGMTT
jgi:hypothetical protein